MARKSRCAPPSSSSPLPLVLLLIAGGIGAYFFIFAKPSDETIASREGRENVDFGKDPAKAPPATSSSNSKANPAITATADTAVIAPAPILKIPALREVASSTVNSAVDAKLPTATMPNKRELATALLDVQTNTSAVSAIKNAKYTKALMQHEVSVVAGDAIAEINSNLEGKQFLQLFFNDEYWLEEFLCSGPFDDMPTYDKTTAQFSDKASLALKRIFLVWSAHKDCADNKLFKNLATGLSLASAFTGSSNSNVVVTAYEYYLESYELEKLHPVFETYASWEMKYLGGAWWINRVDALEWSRENINIPITEYALGYKGIHFTIPYRSRNEFGGFVHRGDYHDPWLPFLSWTESAYNYGGVCGAQSAFACYAAKSHGIIATPVACPGHCAFAVRVARGDWRNGFGTGTHVNGKRIMYAGSMQIPSLYLADEVFSNREALKTSNSFLWLARLQTNPEIKNAFIEEAIAAQPYSLDAWSAKVQFNVEQNLSKEEWQAFTNKLQDETKRYPYFAEIFFYRYRNFAGLSTDDDLADFWSYEADYLAKYAYWSKKYEQKARKLKGATHRLHNGNLFLFQNKLIREFDKMSAASKEKMLKSFMVAFAKGPDKGFNFRSWAMSRTKKKGKTINSVLANLGSLENELKGNSSNSNANKVLEAAGAEDVALFNSASKAALNELSAREQKLLDESKKIKLKTIKDTLLSKGGLVKLSASHTKKDAPGLHSSVLVPGGGYLHTDDVKNDPWVIVMMPKYSEIAHILLYNDSPKKANAMIKIEVSEDGTNWNNATSVHATHGQIYIDLGANKVSAKYVRFTCNYESSTAFVLRNILIYGRRLE